MVVATYTTSQRGSSLMSPKPGTPGDGCAKPGGLPRYASPTVSKGGLGHRHRSPGYSLRGDGCRKPPPPPCGSGGRSGYGGGFDSASRRPMSPLSPHSPDDASGNASVYTSRNVRACREQHARGFRTQSPQSPHPGYELPTRGFARKLRSTDSPTRALGYPSPAATSEGLRMRRAHRVAPPTDSPTVSQRKHSKHKSHTPHRQRDSHGAAQRCHSHSNRERAAAPAQTPAAAEAFPSTPAEGAAATPAPMPTLSPRPGEPVNRHKVQPPPPAPAVAAPAADEKDEAITTEMRFAALSAFAFGDAPAESDAEKLATAPPLGTQMKAPKQPLDPACAQDVMARFAVLCDTVTAVAQGDDVTGDTELLPHIPTTDVIKQVVRRINGFTDTGAARAVRNYRPVFAAFLRVVTTVFRTVGKGVRSSAVVDLLGCLFDMKLSLDYCAPWVAEPELNQLLRVVVAGADPAVTFAALLLMIRQQCTFLGSEHGIDTSAVGVCIGELLPITERAAEQYKNEAHVLFKELYRFTDSHDSHWAAMKAHFSLDDDPMKPSPLGAVLRMVRIIVDTVGVARAQSSMAGLGVSRGCRLQQVVDMVCSQGAKDAAATAPQTPVASEPAETGTGE